MREPAGGDVGIYALIHAGGGIVLTPVARIQRHHIR